MKKLLVGLSIAASLTACTTTKDWQATGGSKADGVIRLSYEIGTFETASTSEAQAISVATQRCSAWGYTSAQAFGGITRQCAYTTPFGECTRWQVTKEYQCTGDTGKAPVIQVRQESYVIPGWNGSN